MLSEYQSSTLAEDVVGFPSVFTADLVARCATRAGVPRELASA